MAGTEDNVAKLRDTYKLWNETRGESVGEWLDLMADDVTFHSPGKEASGLDFSEGRCGKVEVEKYFAGLKNEWEMIHFTPEQFIADGDRVVMLGRCAFKNLRTGIAVESTKADFFLFRDGKVVEYREFFDSAKALAAACPG